jgi:hypothetical protein
MTSYWLDDDVMLDADAMSDVIADVIALVVGPTQCAPVPTKEGGRGGH